MVNFRFLLSLNGHLTASLRRFVTRAASLGNEIDLFAYWSRAVDIFHLCKLAMSEFRYFVCSIVSLTTPVWNFFSNAFVNNLIIQSNSILEEDIIMLVDLDGELQMEVHNSQRHNIHIDAIWGEGDQLVDISDAGIGK